MGSCSLNAGWAGEERGREGSQTIEFTWERGTGKIVREMLRQKPFLFFSNPFFSIVSCLNKSSPCKDKSLKLKGLTRISSSQYQISPAIFVILILEIETLERRAHFLVSQKTTSSSYLPVSHISSCLALVACLSPPLWWLFSFAAATASHAVTFALPFDQSQNATFRKLTYQRKWKYEAGQPNVLLSYPDCH